MNFEELLNYCTNLNESNSEKCLICHIPIDQPNNSYIELKCKHIYHTDCIKYKSGPIKCLYCEKISNPIIHQNKSIQNQKNILCKFILKTGPNKGKYCERSNCQYHLNKITNDSIIILNEKLKKNNKILKTKKKIFTEKFCNYIIKSGPNIGKQCKRPTPCLYHKNQVKSNNIKLTNMEPIDVKSSDNNIETSDTYMESSESDIIIV